MKEIVAATDLKIGMFVAELDRPWLDSPFLIQGFVVENQATLDKLQDLCRFVSVDWQRSTGEHYRAPVRESVASTVGHSLAGSARIAGRTVTPRPKHDFVDVLRWLRSGGETPPELSSSPAGRPLVDADVPTTGRRSTDHVSDDEASPREGWRARMSRWFAREEAPAPYVVADPLADKEETLGPAREGASATVWIESAAVEDELFHAAPAYESAQGTVEQLIADVQQNLRPDMERVRANVEDMMQSVVRNPDALLWLTRLKRTDQYAYDHALDVSVLLMVFARSLGMTAHEMTLLGIVGLMQDIGKVRLPPRLLKKSGLITPLERQIFQAHVDYSLAILKDTPDGSPEVLEIVARHHERFDGSGYPDGIAGDAIGRYSEMAGLVDTYCAMTRERPWGDALSPQTALEQINTMRDRDFSETVVDTFIQCVGLYPVGTLVALNTGEVAVVIAQNQVRRLRPRVLVLLAPDHSPNAHPPTLDLLYDPVAPDGSVYEIRKALPPGAYGIDPKEFYLG
ncbi:MAG TPA: HD-GYP domain-containing protein [Denitromonas sp.]|uniref:HD-GYP domain-containing protein n=1 Tax=Denitromonas sp. TaxID=2734609 RepID=UPI001D5C00E1|nr:HD-GYP domain-containing protein [Rhodocyclaceae bacterium]MCP5221665.1 HD-GYP domain-containing protein [Zoogloeaceae bacterium]HQU88976.1 HD-GYP domain-containing protein [Denitromonas sp.]HQV15166.1 HD-GYP domain-containing protein [Denitromonas sp.]